MPLLAHIRAVKASRVTIWNAGVVNVKESLPVTNYQGVSVVVPVYRGSKSLTDLTTRTLGALSSYQNHELIFVDDGSPDDSWDVILQLVDNGVNVRGIRLGRNFGQHNALVAGVRAARFTVTVTMDDDLQNPPEEIPRLVETLLNDGLDVVYGVPNNVEQSFPRRLSGRLTRTILKRVLGVQSAPDMSSFRVFRTQLRDAFASDIGTNVSLDALLTWGGSRFGAAEVRHDARTHGHSNYTFRRLLRFAIDTTTGYSTFPLQVASILGLITAAFGVGVLVFVVGRPLISGQSVPGFPFLAATIAIFAGVQLFTLGVIGEYLARMHFRIMRKPTYAIRETI